MRVTLIKWFMACNAFLIRISKGRIAGKLGTQSILILHTEGRRSGKARSTPVAYFDYQGKYLLVASNWGRQRQADWLLNLRRQPQASVEIKGKSLRVRARESEQEEYARLWEYVTLRHPPYVRHQRMTARRIPIVVLEPSR